MEVKQVIKICALLMCTAKARKKDSWHHDIDTYPGMVFVKRSQLVFIKEKPLLTALAKCILKEN